MIILLSINIVIIGTIGYACWNLLKKNEKLEDVINEFYGRTNATVRLMRALDNRQMFEPDDEVGTVFKQLVECVDLLYSFVTEIRNGNSNINTEEER
jgi:hypothetical protein